MGVADVVIAGLVVAGAVAGWRLGLVTRVVTWVLMAGGLVLAVRLLPWVLARLGDGGGVRSAVVAVVVVFVGLAAGQAIGFAVGGRLAPRRRGSPVRTADRVAGAAVGAVAVVALLWLMLPVLASTPGVVSRAVADSAAARAVDRWLPDPPDAIQGLRALVGEGPFPEVFETLRPTPDPGPPPPETGIDEATSAQVVAAVVRVEARGCDRVQNGTGFTAAVRSDGRSVVTNAHVVAGAAEVEVVDVAGRAHLARVEAFDPVTDLAVLAVDTLGAPVLAFGAPVVGESGGAYGHPGGGPLRIAPARVVGLVDAVGRDIYGQPGARRRVVELAAAIAPGDSGSPVVDTGGRVVGVVFAVATDRAGVGYALAPEQVGPLLDGAVGGSAVSTGPCIT